jgi:hypothetical protein
MAKSLRRAEERRRKKRRADKNGAEYFDEPPECKMPVELNWKGQEEGRV